MQQIGYARLEIANALKDAFRNSAGQIQASCWCGEVGHWLLVVRLPVGMVSSLPPCWLSWLEGLLVTVNQPETLPSQSDGVLEGGDDMMPFKASVRLL
jgi:hypothetical protein